MLYSREKNNVLGYFKVFLEVQHIQNSQRQPKKKWSWSNQAPELQITLQSNNHQNHMVLAQKQKSRSVEQDRKPRIKPMQLIYDKVGKNVLWKKRQLVQ